MWCGVPGKSFGTGTSTATYSFVIGGSDPVYNTWTADAYVEWNDPNGSSSNTITVTAAVTHSGSTTSATLLNINGTTSRSCTLESANLISAVAGDTVTFTVTTSIVNNNVTAQVSRPTIYTIN